MNFWLMMVDNHLIPLSIPDEFVAYFCVTIQDSPLLSNHWLLNSILALQAYVSCRKTSEVYGEILRLENSSLIKNLVFPFQAAMII